MKPMIAIVSLLILTLSICHAAPGSYIARKYTITGSVTLTDMNDSGVIVGNENNQAFRVYNGVKTFLQMPSQYTCSKASAIGESGIIVGAVGASTSSYKPCYWDANGEMHLLVDPNTYVSGEALAINSKNQIVGYFGRPPTMWTDFTQKKVLRDWAYAVGINDNGTIILRDNYLGQSFYWSDTQNKFIRLGTPSGITGSYANRINNRGQILGTINGTYFSAPQVVWTDYNNPRELPFLTGSDGYKRPWQASDINDSAFVVGTAPGLVGSGHDRPPVACLWDDSNVYALDVLVAGVFDGQTRLNGVSFSDAYFINNNNQILCRGTYNGQSSYYMLAPVPEPSSLIGLICGLGGLAVLRRRR